MTDQTTKRRLAKLDALEAYGIDNWEYTSEALSGWNKEQALVESAAQKIEVLFTGISFSVEEACAETEKLLFRLIEDYQCIDEEG